MMNLQCVPKFIHPHLHNKYDIEVKEFETLGTCTWLWKIKRSVLHNSKHFHYDSYQGVA